MPSFNEMCFNDRFDIACRFAKDQVEQLDKNKQWSRALDGSDYLPGMVIVFFIVVGLPYLLDLLQGLNLDFVEPGGA